jgi:hypothetical protein
LVAQVSFQEVNAFGLSQIGPDAFSSRELVPTSLENALG